MPAWRAPLPHPYAEETTLSLQEGVPRATWICKTMVSYWWNRKRFTVSPCRRLQLWWYPAEFHFERLRMQRIWEPCWELSQNVVSWSAVIDKDHGRRGQGLPHQNQTIRLYGCLLSVSMCTQACNFCSSVNVILVDVVTDALARAITATADPLFGENMKKALQIDMFANTAWQCVLVALFTQWTKRDWWAIGKSSCSSSVTQNIVWGGGCGLNQTNADLLPIIRMAYSPYGLNMPFQLFYVMEDSLGNNWPFSTRLLVNQGSFSLAGKHLL